MRVPLKYLKSRVCNLGTAGLLTAVFGLVMAFYGFPKIVRSQIAKRVALKNGTEGFELWKDMPFPLTFKVYFFNVTNPEEIVSGSKPKLKEIGPYVYDEHRYKDDVKVEQTDTLSYNLKKVFKFNEELSSPLKEDDAVTILNMALVGMAITINNLLPPMMSKYESIIPFLFDNPSDPFLRATVSEILFDGVFINCTSTDMTVGILCKGMKSRLPPTMRVSDDDDGYYYSMFHHMNDTYDGPYVIHSGVNDTSNLGNIVSYKDERVLYEWDDECSEMKGTDTTIFAPINESNFSKVIHIFQPDVCRSMFAEFVAKKLTFGLQTYRFETTKMVLGGVKTNPANKCYCTRNWSYVHDACNLDGVQNLDPCQKTPVIASFPHFYLADPVLLEYIAEGLSPDKAKHGTYVDIEPKTGAAMKGAKRLQFNMELPKFSSISMLSSVEPGIFPIIWIEESAEVNHKVKQMLMSVHDKIKYLKVLQWIIVATGIILMLAACHFKRRGFTDKWSWSPNRVEADLPTYGASVPENEVARPAAAQKEGRFHCFQNKAFNSNEEIAHK